MKTIAAILACAFLAGCTWSPVEVENQSPMRKVASRDNLIVYVTTIDGSDYLIVTGQGTAICPKVKPE